MTRAAEAEALDGSGMALGKVLADADIQVPALPAAPALPARGGHP